MNAVDLTENAIDHLPRWPYKPANAALNYYSQPALSPDGKTLYVGTAQLNGNQGTLEALVNVERDAKHDPVTLWSYPLTETDPLPGNIYGAILLDNNVVYFADGKGQVFALNAESGEPAWSQPFQTEARIWSSPVLDADRIYVASQDHHLYAIDKTSGKQAWRFPADNTEVDALVGSPTLANGTVYVGSFGGTLYAVNAATGQLKWSHQADGSLWDGPALANGTLYFGDLSGNVYALDEATGQNRQWTAKVEGGVGATPLVAQGVVYIGTDQHRLYALNQDTGGMVWTEGPFTGTDGENMLVTPVLRGDLLIVLPQPAGTDLVQLYGLDKSTGKMVWRYPAAKQQ